MQNFEKLGEFYLGKVFDPATSKIQKEMLLYDSPDLTTHAVCIGMTGSGKTGLCIGLLEEAALDSIPALVIDPKGDMTNLGLSFPELSAEDFRPWINKDEARKKNLSQDDYAKSEAKKWKTGLDDWGQSSERIRELNKKVDIQIYTPGSNSGIPLRILNSFEVPSQEILDDTDLFHELISTNVTGILGLLGMDADPIQSREHILLSNIMMHFWNQGLPLDMTRLIQSLQNPPVDKIGIFDIDSFYPSEEKFEQLKTV